ncbi:MAG: hypothetical protein N2442_07720 [Spirochaetes bacterium]|nr:hypothetical protein [Spirochaetota bacterium]
MKPSTFALSVGLGIKLNMRPTNVPHLGKSFLNWGLWQNNRFLCASPCSVRLFILDYRCWMTENPQLEFRQDSFSRGNALFYTSDGGCRFGLSSLE